MFLFPKAAAPANDPIDASRYAITGSSVQVQFGPCPTHSVFKRETEELNQHKSFHRTHLLVVKNMCLVRHQSRRLKHMIRVIDVCNNTAELIQKCLLYRSQKE